MQNQNDPTLARYKNGDYFKKNPDWDSSDADWKARKLIELLAKHQLQPSTIVEVGCGSGAVLIALKNFYPDAILSGFDIAPDAQLFWEKPSAEGIRLELADYLHLEEPVPDVLLLLDVLEHIANPWEFLQRLSNRTKLVAIHFPLDLSALSVFRETPLLNVRDKVGHLHYFTRGLAISLLNESGFEVIDSGYTGAAFEIPHRSVRTRIAGLFRRFAYAINHDLGVLLLGGETLMVLARPKKT